MATAALVVMALASSAQAATAPAGQIVFISANRVMAMDADGANRRVVEAGPATSPALSPDGSKVAFRSDRGGAIELWVVNTDGSGLTRLTSDTVFEDEPTWSPDGTQIAYRRGDAIWAMNADGSDQHAVYQTSTGFSAEPSWSPTGDWIAFTTNTAPGGGWVNVGLVRPDGTGFWSPTAIRRDGFGWGAQDPDWSPDGSRIAFVSNRPAPHNWRIYSMALDGSDWVEITNAVEPVRDLHPTWSPDGGAIAYRSIASSRTGIYTAHADGSGGELRLTPATVSDDFPDWAGVAGQSDTEPPTVSVPADTEAEATGPDGAQVSYSASASDDVGGSLPVTCSPESGSTFALGDTLVTCEAEDAAGNRAEATFHVLVADTTPPEITVPADIEVDATSPSGALVAYSASAEDLVDGDVSPTCTPASGSTFAAGDTTVTCEAVDDHGNRASKAFGVHVRGAAEQADRLADDSTGAGPGTSLADKASDAAAAIDAGDLAGACTTLHAYLNQVRAQSGKKLTAEQADELGSAAERIRAVIGC